MFGAYFSNSNMRYAYMYPFDYAGWPAPYFAGKWWSWKPVEVPKYAKYGFPSKYKDAERSYERAWDDHDFTYYVPRWPWDPDPNAKGNDWEITYAKFHNVDFRYANLRIDLKENGNPMEIPYIADSGDRWRAYDTSFKGARMDEVETNYDVDGDPDHAGAAGFYFYKTLEVLSYFY